MNDPSHHRAINLVACRSASKHHADSQPQADGEILDPLRADRILALDERLTRQFGKTLAVLIRLREMQNPTLAR